MLMMVVMIDWLNVDCVLQELQTRASEGHSNFKLRDLLTVPMQRVLKYHLLLKVRHIVLL